VLKKCATVDEVCREMSTKTCCDEAMKRKLIGGIPSRSIDVSSVGKRFPLATCPIPFRRGPSSDCHVESLLWDSKDKLTSTCGSCASGMSGASDGGCGGQTEPRNPATPNLAVIAPATQEEKFNSPITPCPMRAQVPGVYEQPHHRCGDSSLGAMFQNMTPIAL
jgi:hypothetical protein